MIFLHFNKDYTKRTKGISASDYNVKQFLKQTKNEFNLVVISEIVWVKLKDNKNKEKHAYSFLFLKE